MKKTIGIVLFTLALSIAVQSQQQTGRDLSWAFPVKNGDLPPEPAGTKSIPGSPKTYPQTQIDDLSKQFGRSVEINNLMAGGMAG